MILAASNFVDEKLGEQLARKRRGKKAGARASRRKLTAEAPKRGKKSLRFKRSLRPPLHKQGAVFGSVFIDSEGRAFERGPRGGRRFLSQAEFDRRSSISLARQKGRLQKVSFERLPRYEIRSDGLIFDDKRNVFISDAEFSRRLRISLANRPLSFTAPTSFLSIQDLKQMEKSISSRPKKEVEYELKVETYQHGRKRTITTKKIGFPKRTKSSEIRETLQKSLRNELWGRGLLVNTERRPAHKPGSPDWTVFGEWQLVIHEK